MKRLPILISFLAGAIFSLLIAWYVNTDTNDSNKTKHSTPEMDSLIKRVILGDTTVHWKDIRQEYLYRSLNDTSE